MEFPSWHVCCGVSTTINKTLDAEFKMDMELKVVVDKIKSGQKPAAVVCAI